MWGERPQNDIKLFTSKKKSKWFSEGFSLWNGRRRGWWSMAELYCTNWGWDIDLIMYKVPLDVQSLLACDYLILFLSLFSLPTPSVSFPLPASFLRPDFAPPSRLEKLVKVPIPMSGFLIRQGKDYSNEKEWERQKEGEKFMRERREEAAREYQRYEQRRRDGSWEVCVWLTLLSRRAEEGQAGEKYSRISSQCPGKLFLHTSPHFCRAPHHGNNTVHWPRVTANANSYHT